MCALRFNAAYLIFNFFVAVTLAGCDSPPSRPDQLPQPAVSAARVVAEVGPLEIGLSINTDGEVSVVSGISSPKLRVGLGPVTLRVGIEDSIQLTRQRKFMLYVVWQDVSGQTWRDEYEIGQEFRVKFKSQEHVSEIAGDNGSVIVVVEKASDAATPLLPSSPITTVPDLIVSANANNGVQFTAPTDGNYKFTIKQGVYCTKPGLCRSIIRGYLGRDIAWKDWYGVPHPMEQDYELGCWENDTASNPNCAVGLATVVPMKASQYIRWIIMEDKNSFADDAGAVVLAVARLP